MCPNKFYNQFGYVRIANIMEPRMQTSRCISSSKILKSKETYNTTTMSINPKRNAFFLNRTADDR